MKHLLLIGLILFSLTTDIYAQQESAAIPVSCTIPALPGINAPPFEKEGLKVAAAQEEAEHNKSPVILEEKTEEIVLADGKKTSILVETVYSR